MSASVRFVPVSGVGSERLEAACSAAETGAAAVGGDGEGGEAEAAAARAGGSVAWPAVPKAEGPELVWLAWLRGASAD